MKATSRLLFLVGCCLLLTPTVPAATRYVWQQSFTPAPPYDTWLTAATNIQDAIDVAEPGDTVLVSGGVYDTGGRAVYGTMTNRVAIDKAIRVESLMGPEVTVIQGYQLPGTINGDGAIRCVYLASGAVLSGFTLTNGATRTAGDYPQEASGGGLWCESPNATVSNCNVTGNSAAMDGAGVWDGTLHDCTFSGNLASLSGGGAFLASLNHCTLTNNVAWQSGGAVCQATLKNCTLSHNWASGSGGGASSSTLNNCRVSGNSTSGSGGGVFGGTMNNCTLTTNMALHSGGGAWGGMLNNCILYYNTASSEPNYHAIQPGSRLNYCCTTPMPTIGVGNIANEPLFLDPANGNYRLQSTSSCINAGNNSYVTTATDLGGNPRIALGTVDIGAYEYQGPGSTISYAWLQQFGLPTDGSADLVDTDGDLMTTWQEWQADTNPTNAASCLRLTLLSANPSATIAFSSSSNRLYTLLSCSNLTVEPPGPVWNPVPAQIDKPGTGGWLVMTNTNPPSRAFYRVSARFP